MRIVLNVKARTPNGEWRDASASFDPRSESLGDALSHAEALASCIGMGDGHDPIPGDRIDITMQWQVS